MMLNCRSFLIHKLFLILVILVGKRLRLNLWLRMKYRIRFILNGITLLDLRMESLVTLSFSLDKFNGLSVSLVFQLGKSLEGNLILNSRLSC